MLRLGLLGAGTIAAKHAAAAKTMGATIVAVVDRDLPRAQALADAYQARAADDPSKLWNADEVDAVIIAVPNKFHKSLALDAMRSGKDVLLEKPMALSASECDELIVAAEQTQRMLQIGFVHRFTSVGKAAKQLADAKEFGPIRHVRAHLLGRRNIPGLGGWFTTKAVAGGGCLIDIGVHLIDLCLHLLGQPDVEFAVGKTHSLFGPRMRDYKFESMWAGPPNYEGVCDVEDSAFAFIQFASGVTLDLQVAWACNLPQDGSPDSTIALLGDHGGCSFELFGDHLRIRSEVGQFNGETRLALPMAQEMVEQLEDFAEVVTRREYGTGATPEQGRKVQAIVDAIYSASDAKMPMMMNVHD